MAYQNVGTPRFYVSILQWLNSLGKLEANLNYADTYQQTATGQDIIGLVNINPSSQTGLSTTISGSQLLLVFTSNAGNFSKIMPNDNNFFMNLGHTLGGVQTNLNSIGTTWVRVADDYLVGSKDYDGFTIRYDAEGGDADDVEANTVAMSIEQHEINTPYKLGSFLYGTYYDMPHSPDLKLTMTREMDGVKRIRTKGGADLVKHQYTKPAMWGSAGAWELYSGTPSNQELSRSGRRTWSLSFSYLQGTNSTSNDDSIFPQVASLNWYESYDDGVAYGEGTGATLLLSDTFYGQVIHKTNGGQLPFIFQPDNNDNTNFAICKFDMKSFDFKQVANGVYNMKLKIREVW